MRDKISLFRVFVLVITVFSADIYVAADDTKEQNLQVQQQNQPIQDILELGDELEKAQKEFDANPTPENKANVENLTFKMSKLVEKITGKRRNGK